MRYKVRKNALNDVHYITFGRYKALLQHDGYISVYYDLSAFGGFVNLQLLKRIKTDLTDQNDFSTIHAIASKFVAENAKYYSFIKWCN